MTPAPLLSSSDFLDLSFRSDLGILTIRWLRTVTFEELHHGFTLALSMAEEQQTAHWLVDIRRRTELDASSSAWVAQQFLPEAAASLAPASLHVAYLLSPARAELLQQDTSLRAASAAAQAPSQSYRLQTFIDEGPATDWLLQAKQP
ncbi:hypothetical protein [Hymenobacter cellulosivorans]|uniref:STAS/SEC14 domain-containing protein n=1 Tax=Hymenobacter cellulosivorans TaxID=2932249 RepID=A0ABY4F9F0_9BACT|nr:hypothetical protein [Hymenobacter cellulosivorans]UOQ53286.1 hypothetical protein MUN80_00655 [Hymenobacter cellulosivorans]